MEEFIIGYQYGDQNQFCGEYRFPNNRDKEEIHLPPNTTLIPPPLSESIPTGFLAVWNGDSWEVQVDSSVDHNNVFDLTNKLDYANLLPEFINEQKAIGLWTPEMQQKYDEAQLAKSDEVEVSEK